MKDQLEATEAVFRSALENIEFHEKGGNLAALQFYTGELPDRKEHDGEKIYPFCLLQPGPFSFTKAIGTQGVNITIGFLSPGTRGDGLLLVDSILDAVRGTCTARFTPCKLGGEITGPAPEIDHPYYQLSFSLNLTK